MNQNTWWNEDAVAGPPSGATPWVDEPTIVKDEATIVKMANQVAIANAGQPNGRASREPVAAAAADDRPGVLARTGSNAAITGMVAGLLAGAIGVGIFLAVDRTVVLTRDHRIVLLCISVPILVGGLVASWAEAANRSWAAAARRGLFAVAAGVGGSLLGLLAATWIYETFFDKDDALVSALVLAAAFGIIAALSGAAIGFTLSPRQAGLGALGGFVGGGVGGLLISVLSGHEVPLSGHVEQLPIIEVALPIPIATLLIGGSIGLLSQATKSAWITIQEGPMAGREIILDKAKNTIGSASSCDVVLRDPDVGRKHAVIDLTGDQPTLVAVDKHARSQVNRADVVNVELAPHDLVLLGNTYFKVFVR